EAQRAARIELLRFAKRPLRFRMVESECEPDTLVEPCLRLDVVRPRLERELAQVVVEHRLLAQRGFGWDRLKRRRFGFRENEIAQHGGRTASPRAADRAPVE